jgi:hypothetical protein
MPLAPEIAVEAAAVARNRRRDTGMRTIIDSLQFQGRRRRWRRILTAS